MYVTGMETLPQQHRVIGQQAPSTAIASRSRMQHSHDMIGM